MLSSLLRVGPRVAFSRGVHGMATMIPRRPLAPLHPPLPLAATLLPIPPSARLLVRGFKTPLKKPKTKLKTKRAAKKRFIATGHGKLKRNHAGKQHLTGHMSRTRKTRLNAKVFLSGTNLKNMKKLINS